jgi:hypothetical protein
MEHASTLGSQINDHPQREEYLMNKTEIINALTESREIILEVIQDIPVREMETPGVIDDWSVKDILVHLTRWEAELVKLLWQMEQGSKPTTVHFDPASVDEINLIWFKASHERTLQLVMQDFLGVRSQTIRRVEALSENILNDPNFYPWLEKKAVWQWIADDSFEHEAEHLTQIRAWQRIQEE